MRIFRYMPENRQRFAYMFPTWEAAVEASREMMQGQFGLPAVYRISDPEETDVGLKLYGIYGTPVDTFMKIRGYKSMQRCLMLGTAEGEKGYAKHVRKMIGKICKKHGAMSPYGFRDEEVGAHPVQGALHARGPARLRHRHRHAGVRRDLGTTCTGSTAACGSSSRKGRARSA